MDELGVARGGCMVELGVASGGCTVAAQGRAAPPATKRAGTDDCPLLLSPQQLISPASDRAHV